MIRSLAFVVLLVLTAALGPVQAQNSTAAPPDTARAWYETAWTPIVVRNGVQIAYLFYSEADNKNDGVVLRLRNRNDYPVRYAFTVIFRGPGAEATARAEGTLQAGEMKTGENDGLFWIPFKEQGQSVGEIGLRGIRVVRTEDTHRSSE
jgi:hypothetical protein